MTTRHPRENKEFAKNAKLAKEEFLQVFFAPLALFASVLCPQTTLNWG